MVEDASEALKALPNEARRTDRHHPAPYIDHWPIPVRLLILIGGAVMSWALVYAIVRMLG